LPIGPGRVPFVSNALETKWIFLYVFISLVFCVLAGFRSEQKVQSCFYFISVGWILGAMYFICALLSFVFSGFKLWAFAAFKPAIFVFFPFRKELVYLETRKRSRFWILMFFWPYYILAITIVAGLHLARCPSVSKIIVCDPFQVIVTEPENVAAVRKRVETIPSKLRICAFMKLKDPVVKLRFDKNILNFYIYALIWDAEAIKVSSNSCFP
jgi:hypothetical protein